ncbi:MAG: hypothetical protein ACRDRG_08845 [Pseudonocardiaceae bacterium]
MLRGAGFGDAVAGGTVATAINYVRGLVEPGKLAAGPGDDDPEAAATTERFEDTSPA